MPVTANDWSRWRDLNPRPLRPERSALPNWATPRNTTVILYHTHQTLSRRFFLFCILFAFFTALTFGVWRIYWNHSHCNLFSLTYALRCDIIYIKVLSFESFCMRWWNWWIWRKECWALSCLAQWLFLLLCLLDRSVPLPWRNVLRIQALMWMIRTMCNGLTQWNLTWQCATTAIICVSSQALSRASSLWNITALILNRSALSLSTMNCRSLVLSMTPAIIIMSLAVRKIRNKTTPSRFSVSRSMIRIGTK